MKWHRLYVIWSPQVRAYNRARKEEAIMKTEEAKFEYSQWRTAKVGGLEGGDSDTKG